MKYRFWLALPIAPVSVLSGYSWAQYQANAKGDEAKARESALAISKKWNSSEDFEASAAKLYGTMSTRYFLSMIQERRAGSS